MGARAPGSQKYLESVTLSVEPLKYIRHPGHGTGTSPLRAARLPLLVLLHPAGSTERDFLPIADGLEGEWLVASVRAPIEKSKEGFAWYRFSPFDIAQPNMQDIRHGTERLERTIGDIITQSNADPDQVYLLGIDQGATMALSILLSYPRLVNGVLAFGGTRWEDMRYSVVDRDALRGKGLFLGYGMYDKVLPLAVARQVRSICTEFDVDLTYREYSNVGHTPNRRVISDMLSWLSEHAARASRRMGHIETRARMGYVVLRVRNLQRAVVFYQRYLELRLVERVGARYAFLSGSARHHDLTLFQVGTDALDHPPGTVGVERIAFEVPNQRAFAQIYTRLKKDKIPLKAVNRLIAWELEFKDPDGNSVVVYCDTRDLPGAADLWQGRDLPLPEDEILRVQESS